MSEEAPITLDILARQLDHLLDRQGTLEDRIAVLTRRWMRLDGAVEGFATEVRNLQAEKLFDHKGRA